MQPSRSSQPYRQGSQFREPGEALFRMLQGRTGYGTNPQDVPRRTAQQGSLLQSLLKR